MHTQVYETELIFVYLGQNFYHQYPVNNKKSHVKKKKETY